MMVPSTRLILLSAFLVVPCAAVASAIPRMSLAAGILLMMFFLVVIVDGVFSQDILSGINVRLPEVVRLLKDREGTLDLSIENDRKKARRLRVGFPLPHEIVSPQEDFILTLPEDSPYTRFSWPCTAVKRGKYLIDRCYLESTSRLTLWAVRRAIAVSAEIRVYPNLSDERKHLSALFLNRGSFGIHAQRLVGQGRDFEKLREYIPGDGFDEIHWKATAKRGHPVTKVFQIERTQEVYVLIDASRLSARPSVLPGRPQDKNATVLDRFLTGALILAHAAERAGDLYGLLTFSDKVHSFIRAGNGKAHYSACRELLYTMEPRIVTPDFEEMFAFIRLRLRRRALLVFLTSLDDPILAETFLHDINLICRHHLVLVNMMSQAGFQPLFSDPTLATLDELYRSLGGHTLWHNLRELEKVLQRVGVQFHLLNNEKMSAELVAQYLSVKQRQIL